MIRSGRLIAPRDVTACSSLIRWIVSIRCSAIHRRALKPRSQIRKFTRALDHKRSFVMFGDFDTGMDAPLAGYARKLTGVKAHLENSRAISSRSPARDPTQRLPATCFPGGTLGIIQLSNAEILPGSEIVMLEVARPAQSGSDHLARNAGALGRLQPRRR